LFLKFKTKRKKFFLDPNRAETFSYDGNEKLSIILSPALYWVKKISLNVKYLREIRPLLPSLFEDMLPDGNYSYYVYKEGSEYIAFAYEDQKILALLKEQNIALANVASVHFAQSELQFLDVPVGVNDKEVLYVKDGIVLLAPKEWFASVENLNLEAVSLSNKQITLQQFGHLFDRKSFYKIAIGLALFAVVLVVQIIIIKEKTETIEQEKSKVFQKYHLKATMMQNRSILEHYKTIYKNQIHLRSVVEKILSLPLAKTQKITQIRYEDKKLITYIDGVKSKQIALSIENSLKHKEVDFKSKYVKNRLIVEVKI